MNLTEGQKRAIGIAVIFLFLAGIFVVFITSTNSASSKGDGEVGANGQKAEDWWRWGVVYQIYPRSFQDSDGDGVGDLNGIRSRVNYIASLGVQAVWLNPIYPSPMADFGYDVADYVGIHPMFGTMQDFDGLVADLHERGIKVLLDFVPNHSSSEHPWFIASRDGGEQGEKRSWYIWKDGKGGSVPTNWLSRFGGSAWEKPKGSSQYYFHHFLTEQPDLNFTNPDVVKAIQESLAFWLARGVDGFRVDALTSLFEDPLWRDEPPNPSYRPGLDDPFDSLDHIYTENVPPLHEIIQGMRVIIDSYSNTSTNTRILICETYAGYEELIRYYGCDASGKDKKGEKLCEKECHLPFNFRLLLATNSIPVEIASEVDSGKVVPLEDPISPKNMTEAIKSYLYALYSMNNTNNDASSWRTPNWVLGNHDQKRFGSPSRFGKFRQRVATMMLLSLPGGITTYYGDEIGMQDVDIKPSQIKDPAALRQTDGKPHPGLGRDPERTPMQWNRSESNAGFTFKGVKPWLPLPKNIEPDGDVVGQQEDPKSLLALFQDLTRLRREEKAIAGLGFMLVNTTSTSIISYVRYPIPMSPPASSKSWLGCFLFIGNFGNTTVSFNIENGNEHELPGLIGSEKDWVVYLHTDTISFTRDESFDLSSGVTLAPGEGYLLKRSEFAT